MRTITAWLGRIGIHPAMGWPLDVRRELRWLRNLYAPVIVAAMLLTGCGTVQPGAWWQSVTNAVSGESQHSENGESSTPTSSQTTTTTTVPASGDAVAMSALRWNRGGINHSSAVRDPAVTITRAAISGNVLRYGGTGLTVWPVTSQGQNINGVISIFFDEDGDGTYERGGKFDWSRSNAQDRPLQHLDGRYSNWDGYPKGGTPWAVVITTERGDKRSNIVTGLWP